MSGEAGREPDARASRPARAAGGCSAVAAVMVEDHWTNDLTWRARRRRQRGVLDSGRAWRHPLRPSDASPRSTDSLISGVDRPGRRLGSSPSTINAYFYDPAGRRRGRSRRGMSACAGVAAPTPSLATARGMPRRIANAATQARSSVTGHTRGVFAAMREWPERHGRLPTSYDWSRTHARRCGGRRSSGWVEAIGPRRARSPARSARGAPLARWLRSGRGT
jgi:hypothetical protein